MSMVELFNDVLGAVQDVQGVWTCMRCGVVNSHFKWVCAQCDDLEQHNEGLLRDE